MAKKKIAQLNWMWVSVAGILALGLATLLYLVNNRTSDPNALAAEVRNRIICAVNMRPTLVCPLGGEVKPINRPFWKWWHRRSDCNWQCTPLPTLKPLPRVSSLPLASCKPRPACVDSVPRCLLPEPVEGWCPGPTIRPKPSYTLAPLPSTCPYEILCPLGFAELGCGCQPMP